MVGTKTPRRYKPRKKGRVMRRSADNLPLYPSRYDSCVFYFNYSIAFAATNAVPITGFYAIYTSQVLSSGRFISSGNFFSKYRVESMFLEISFADKTLFPWTECSIAPIHDVRAWTQTSDTMDSQRYLKSYGNDVSRVTHYWKMDPDLIADTQFLEIPTATVLNPANNNGGFLWQIKMARVQQVDLVHAFDVNVRFKVRVTGRSVSGLF